MRKILIISMLVALASAQVATDNSFVSAEASALAGAVVANPGGESSLFHNPAGLAEVDYQFVSFGTADLFGVNTSYLALIADTPWLGKLGFAVQQSKASSGGTTLSEEQSFGISGGYYLQKDRNSNLSVGYTVNILNWSLGRTAGISGDGSDGLPSASGSAIGIDIGILASLRGKHRIGAYLKNFNSPVMGKGESQQNLPRRIVVGAAYAPVENLVTSLVVDKPLGNDIEVKGGIQYKFTDMVTLRLGLHNNPNRMGAGIQLNLKSFNLDYGLLTHPVLPVVQQFSLGWKF